MIFQSSRLPSGLRLLLVLLGLLVLVPGPALAEGVLPEVLLIVDTSASMQHKLQGEGLPLCGSADPSVPDGRSRWNAVREIIGGTFADYRCKYESLPKTAEALSPPSPLVGPQACIPGLDMAISTDSSYVANLSGSKRWSDVSTTTTMRWNDLLTSSRSIPWMRFDLSAAPTTDTWLGGRLELVDSGAVAGVGAVTNAVLVLAVPNPETTGAKDFVCGINGQAPVPVLSATTSGVYGNNAVTTFQLTEEGAGVLQALRKGGQTAVHVAVVPVSSKMNATCTAVTGTVSAQQIGWFSHVDAAAKRPKLTLSIGTKCASEGPGKHSQAYGVNELGLEESKAIGKDGLLDIFGPSAKFAFLATDPALNGGVNAAGGFSFAASFASTWGPVNPGMADPYAAGTPSVPITGPDTLAARAATYDAIQTALKNLRPNGPTPLGAQLQDALAYLGPGQYMDPHFKKLAEDPVNGDPYQACRKKLVVVMSDGGSALHDGTSDGRTAAIQAAAALFAAGVPVHVLAIGHPGVGGVPPTADLQFLDDLAAAGGTIKAHPVATPGAAVSVLGPAIAAGNVDNRVFTRPLYTQATGAVGDVQHTFQAMSVFDISQPLRTRGVVEQRIYRCDGACKNDQTPDQAGVCEVVDYQKELVARSAPRRMYTHKTGARLDITPANLTPFDLGIGTVGVGPKLELDVSQACVTTGGYNLSIPSERNAYRDHVLDTLKGAKKSCRENFPLGAPSRSQPALLEPADRLKLRDASFLSYAAATVPSSAAYSDVNPPGSAGRPTMLLVASHDGLLHAFRTDTHPKIVTKDDLDRGGEMWAWLPRFNLTRVAQMKLVTEPNASYLGGAIATGHVLLDRSAATASGVAKNWRAVAIVGAGEAGSGYLALDITAPDDPQLLWEITPDYHCYGPGITVGGVPGPQCLAIKTYQAMGRSVSKPVIASLFYKRGTEPPGEHAVAILPLGKPPGAATVANLGVEGLGQRGVFVVELATGNLVRTFTAADLDITNIATALADPTLLGYHWADIGCFNNAPGQLVTRCFQGDDKGMLWRLDLSDPDPADWSMRFFHDAYGGPGTPAALQLPINSPDRVPVLSPPSLATTAGGKLAIVYGTGGGEDEASLTRRHVVYSLSEKFSLTAAGTASPPTADRNWVKKLAESERFIGPPLVFANYAYWASYLVEMNAACATGIARVWGGRFDRPQSVSDPEDLQGAYPNPANPSLLSANLDFLDVGTTRPSPVELQPIPACRGSCPPTDPKCVAGLGTGLLGGAKPQYQVGVTLPAPTQGAGQAPKAGAQPSVGTATRAVPQPRSSAMVTGWDLLVD